jgi:hypothetical protein
LRSRTFATGLEPFIVPETFYKVRNFSVIGTMQTQGSTNFSRKDRGIAAAAVLALLLACGICHATYAQQSSPDQTKKVPDETQKAPPPPDVRPTGDPKTGVVKPPNVDPKMAKKVPDVDPGMTQPPPDKQSPPTDQPPPKVQPK